MLCRLVSLAAVVVLATGLAAAQEQQQKQNQADKPLQATITKVDAAKNTITVRAKDATGKETERTFELKGDVKLYDEAGKVVTIDAYRVGNQILVIERAGRVMELRKDKGLPKP